jgi:predicted esterase
MHDSRSDPSSAGVTVLHVRTEIHGRVLIRPAANPTAIVVGFHGYAEDAAAQLDRLTALPGAAAWTCVAIQGLHRFYRGRSQDTVAGWMTRQDRELALDDNIAYVDRVIDQIEREHPDVLSRSGRRLPLAYIGFSQGVAMAFRAGVRGRSKADAIVGVGGDVPPELLADAALSFPRVLLIRGDKDEWYDAAKLANDESALAKRSTSVQALTVDARHEWTPDISNRIAQFLNANLPL